MIKFHTNKELSQALNINLAKWKRWSREFLPPDPLGGLQSGYARQYNLDEGFTIFLGGHLVGDLKFTIPESRQILNDLYQWLVDHDFYFDFSGTANPVKESGYPVQNYQIAIINRKISSGSIFGFSYWVKAVLSVEPVDFGDDQIRQEHFIETLIGPLADRPAYLSAESYCVLNINALRQNFLNSLQKIT